MEKSPLLVNLGLRIKQIRNQKKLTQQQVSELTGLKREYISQLETGEYNVSIETLNKLANAFEVSLSELVEGVEVVI